MMKGPLRLSLADWIFSKRSGENIFCDHIVSDRFYVLSCGLARIENFGRLEDWEFTLRARCYGQLSTCRETKAYVSYSGTCLNYLMRSFGEGYYFFYLLRKWKVLSGETKFVTLTVNFQWFEALRYLFFYLGRYFARLTELHLKETIIGAVLFYLCLSTSAQAMDFQITRKDMLSYLKESLRHDIQLRKCLSLPSTSQEKEKQECAKFNQQAIKILQEKINRDYTLFKCYRKSVLKSDYDKCTAGL